MQIDEGTLEYNGHRFSPRSHVRVSSEIIYDDAERTPIYHRHRITVDDIVVPENGETTTGDRMSELRARLSHAGKELILKDKGFGLDLEVNSGTYGLRDAAFGPKPRVVTWSPIGHTQAAEITWECEVHLPVCLDEEGILGTGIAALNFDIAFNINERGYTTRSVNGHILIAMTRDQFNERNIPDTADNYRELINVERPANFRRITQDYRVSSDKRRLDFTIVDEEIESRNAWPAGVLNIQATHSVTYNKRNRVRFPNTIQMQCALAHDQPASRAWEIFRSIVFSRLQNVIAQGAAGSYIIVGLDVSEDIFGNNFAFQLQYEITSTIDQFLALSGIYLPISIDWEAWDLASRNSVGRRGIANLGHTRNMDSIIDMCDDAPPMTGGLGDGIPTVPPPTTSVVFKSPTPYPLSSWIEFEATLTEETYHPADLYSVTLGPGGIDEKEFDPNLIDDGPAGFDESEIERKIAEGPASMMYRWKGYAERTGFPIPNPGILRVGDVELIPTKERRIMRKDLGWRFGQRFYGMSWDIVYRVNERPDEGAEDLENPVDVEEVI